MLTKNGLKPVSFRCKVYFFWCTVKISNFYLGQLQKSIFVFPRAKFANYKFVDKRPD